MKSTRRPAPTAPATIIVTFLLLGWLVDDGAVGEINADVDSSGVWGLDCDAVPLLEGNGVVVEGGGVGAAGVFVANAPIPVSTGVNGAYRIINTEQTRQKEIEPTLGEADTALATFKNCE